MEDGMSNFTCLFMV